MRESIKKNKNRISEIIKVECDVSKNNLVNYLDEHGSTIEALFKIGYWYRTKGLYKEAMFYLKPLLNTRYKNYVLLEFAKIYIRKKQYYKCYDCMMQLRKLSPGIMDDGGYDSFIYFLASKLNINLDVNYNTLRYRNKMLYKYDKEMAIEHIKNHLNPEITGEPILKGEVYFNKDINIRTLYDEIYSFLENDLLDKSLYSGVIRLNYIYYPNIGDNRNGRMDYLAVSSVVETNNIVTLFPVIQPGGEVKSYNLKTYDYLDLRTKLEEKLAQKHYRQ